MNVQAYYRHIRSLAPFKAAEALRLAREAAALDEAAEARKPRPVHVVQWEHQAGCLPIRLSFGIKVF